MNKTPTINKVYQIAIDGPSGAGKSFVAKEVSSRLGCVYVDTGALYRTIGLHIYRRGIDPKNNAEVIVELDNINIELVYSDNAQHVILNGEDVSEDIRLPEISMYASAVSAIPEVRRYLLDIQRKMAHSQSVIMDGRDIGTVILPDATVKIYLTADIAVRARRRYNELIAKGQDVKYDNVLNDMIQRDHQDSTREASPAVAAEDAVVLDNSDFTSEQTIEAALDIIRSKVDSI